MERKKILLIEDDKKLHTNIKRFLEEENFEVKAVVDGVTGISSAKEWMPDLIICDINIPMKDGYQVLQELSTGQHTRTIPFVFLTAKVEKEDLRKGMTLGADDYLFKPFELDDLINSINTRLIKSSYRNEIKKTENEAADKVYEIEDKILVSISSKMQLFPIKELKYLKTENPYVHLRFANGKYSLNRQTLTEWEAKLPQKYFIRIHRATIINSEFITKIEKVSNVAYHLRLKDEDQTFVVSRRYRSKMKDRFS
ncbi:MAG: response regulator [Ignavibacteria bacterium]|nr:response regulator [Ignavibacteria bacterium]